jgi:multicomponent Na+:H+ antiporter subunit G
MTFDDARIFVTIFLLLAGAIFSFIAALGIFRMPDLFTRMQAAAKTGTLGVGLILLALAFHFFEIGIATRAALVILFLFLTAPIAAHMIARAGYISGVRLWEHSVCDELHDQYDLHTHELSSGEPQNIESVD